MTAIATAPDTTTWHLDPVHSSIEFAVKHLMIVTVKGTFAGVDASIVGDESKPAGANLAVTIATATISTKNEQRDAHLRSADFFDVEKFPTITFAGTRLVGDTQGEFQIIGDLTIRGVTKEITLDATFEGRAKDPWGGTRIGYHAAGKIKRSEFGLTWNQVLEAGGVAVGDEVKINVDAQFVRK